MSRTRRPPIAYALGMDGPSVEVPGWAADWIVRQTNIDRVRVAFRGADPAVDEVLIALRSAAMRWRSSALSSDSGSDRGTSLASSPPLDRESITQWMRTAEAGGLIGIGDRAVRKAITDNRLPARKIGGRWLIDSNDAETYRRQRAA